MKTKPLARCGRGGETRVPAASQPPHPLLGISLTRVPYSPPPFPALTRSLPSSSPHLPSLELLQPPHSLLPPFQSNLSTHTNQSALSQLPSLKRSQGRQGHTRPQVKAVEGTAKMLVKSLSLSLFRFHTELLSLYLLNVKCMNAPSFCQVLIWWQIPAQPRDITFLAPVLRLWGPRCHPDRASPNPWLGIRASPSHQFPGSGRRVSRPERDPRDTPPSLSCLCRPLERKTPQPAGSLPAALLLSS